MALVIQQEFFYTIHYEFDPDIVEGMVVAWSHTEDGRQILTKADRAIHASGDIAGIASIISNTLVSEGFSSAPFRGEIRVHSNGGTFMTDQFSSSVMATSTRPHNGDMSSAIIETNDEPSLRSGFLNTINHSLTYGMGENSGLIISQGLAALAENVPTIGYSLGISTDHNLSGTSVFPFNTALPSGRSRELLSFRYVHPQYPRTANNPIWRPGVQRGGPLAQVANHRCEGCSNGRIGFYDYGINVSVACNQCGRVQILCAQCRKENICKHCKPLQPKKSSIILEASLMDFDGGVALEL
jgi:hypothetical protein